MSKKLEDRPVFCLGHDGESCTGLEIRRLGNLPRLEVDGTIMSLEEQARLIENGACGDVTELGCAIFDWWTFSEFDLWNAVESLMNHQMICLQQCVNRFVQFKLDNKFDGD